MENEEQLQQIDQFKIGEDKKLQSQEISQIFNYGDESNSSPKPTKKSKTDQLDKYENIVQKMLMENKSLKELMDEFK